jgi:uncharacterized membrane protein
MSGEANILFWWVLFGGSHIIGSSIPVRNFFISRIGLLSFKAIYSLIALATFVPLCYVYFNNRHAGYLLYNPGYLIELLAHFIMLAAIIVLLQALVTANPLSTMAELSSRVVRNAQGIQRITRHPQNFAFGLFGLAHMLATPYVGDWIFFGGFIVYGILSSMHQDRRMLAAGSAAVKQFLAETSAVPFAAVIKGKQRLALGEYYPPALAAAVVLFILIRLVHPMLIGGFTG